ncbi:unnamed protein product, partial [Amoebophrya sp. A25]|eukprot:GSA25T00003440001.1
MSKSRSVSRAALTNSIPATPDVSPGPMQRRHHGLGNNFLGSGQLLIDPLVDPVGGPASGAASTMQQPFLPPGPAVQQHSPTSSTMYNPGQPYQAMPPQQNFGAGGLHPHLQLGLDQQRGQNFYPPAGTPMNMTMTGDLSMLTGPGGDLSPSTSMLTGDQGSPTAAPIGIIHHSTVLRTPQGNEVTVIEPTIFELADQQSPAQQVGHTYYPLGGTTTPSATGSEFNFPASQCQTPATASTAGDVVHTPGGFALQPSFNQDGSATEQELRLQLLNEQLRRQELEQQVKKLRQQNQNANDAISTRAQRQQHESDLGHDGEDATQGSSLSASTWITVPRYACIGSGRSTYYSAAVDEPIAEGSAAPRYNSCGPSWSISRKVVTRMDSVKS